MSEPIDRFEQHLTATAGAFLFPPTPDLAQAVRSPSRRRSFSRSVRRAPAWAIAAALFLFALLAVPDVRAGLLNWLRLGSIEIVITPTAAQTTVPRTTATTVSSATPTAGSVEPAALRDLAGSATLESARQRVDFAISLPTYPADLGAPDRIFVQNVDGDAVLLVWLDPAQPERIRLTMQLLTSDIIGQKMLGDPADVRETSVNGQRALWVDAPHLLQFYDRGELTFGPRRLVEGNVLIWFKEGITYRLETDQPMDEVVKIAESLR